jgi:hypothetical protein
MCASKTCYESQRIKCAAALWQPRAFQEAVPLYMVVYRTDTFSLQNRLSDRVHLRPQQKVTLFLADFVVIYCISISMHTLNAHAFLCLSQSVRENSARALADAMKGEPCGAPIDTVNRAVRYVRVHAAVRMCGCLCVCVQVPSKLCFHHTLLGLADSVDAGDSVQVTIASNIRLTAQEGSYELSVNSGAMTVNMDSSTNELHV